MHLLVFGNDKFLTSSSCLFGTLYEDNFVAFAPFHVIASADDGMVTDLARVA